MHGSASVGACRALCASEFMEQVADAGGFGMEASGRQQTRVGGRVKRQHSVERGNDAAYDDARRRKKFQLSV